MCFSLLQDITLFNNVQALILTISVKYTSHFYTCSTVMLVHSVILLITGDHSITFHCRFSFLIRLGEESHSVVFLLWMPCMQLCYCQESMDLMCRLSYQHDDIPAFHQHMRKSNNMLVVQVLSSFKILYPY
jgi:hypothetical protein